MTAKKTIAWCRETFGRLSRFFDQQLSLFSGAMSFITFFSFIPFLMVGVFIAVNVSIFQVYFVQFQEFLYENLFIDSASSVVTHVNGFLQNSAKLGFMGVVFALYSVYIFIRQLDFCILRLEKKEHISFGIVRSAKYIAVLSVAVLSFSASAALEAVENFIGITLLAHVALFLQIWLSMWLFFYLIPHGKQTAPRSAIYALISTLSLAACKKLFVIYLTFGVSYTTIYGSFAALFFFFIWLNLSWYVFFALLKLYLAPTRST